MKRPQWMRPHLAYQLLWVLYLVWFFWLNTHMEARYIIHSPIDDLIPFCEWFAFPYCSWFLLLAGVTLWLWWTDTPSYDRLVLVMFSGMFFCLILYGLLPNGLNLRPEHLDRQNIAVSIMQALWATDAPVNVCPSIHCQSSAAMAMVFSHSASARRRPALRVVAWLWAGLICASTVFTKQHSIIDVVLGLALVLPWYLVLYSPLASAGKKAGTTL